MKQKAEEIYHRFVNYEWNDVGEGLKISILEAIETALKEGQKLPKGNVLYTLLGAVKAKDYKCPNCGKWHNDNDEQYKVNNEQYPKRFNERKGSTMDGSYWNWDEVHCCEDCETKYWFSNGAY